MGHDVSFPSCIRTGVPILKWRFVHSHKFFLFGFVASCGSFFKTMVYNGYLRARNHSFKMRHIIEKPCMANELASKYDLLIAGSDQVWNSKCAVPVNYQLYIGNIPDGQVPMVGYAVSGGDGPLDGKTKDELLGAYRRFRAVSFRERTLGEQLGIEKPVVTLDPSLVLSKADYDEIEDKSRPIKGDYLFAYSATQDPKVLMKIKELGNALGVRVVMAQIYSHWFWNKGLPHNDCIGLTPGEMVHHIRHAKYVVSASFHGTAVSIANGARFIHISGRVKPYEGRAFSLLESLGVADRMADVETDVKEMVDVLQRGYSCDIATKKDESLSFLRNAISGIECDKRLSGFANT